MTPGQLEALARDLEAEQARGRVESLRGAGFPDSEIAWRLGFASVEDMRRWLAIGDPGHADRVHPMWEAEPEVRRMMIFERARWGVRETLRGSLCGRSALKERADSPESRLQTGVL